MTAGVTSGERLHALDALRGFALLCGVVLHVAMSYLPGFTVWPLLDRSTSTTLAVAFFTIHMFRMTTFFVIAGFFARLLMERRGLRAFVRNRATRIVVPLVVGWVWFFPPIVVAMWWVSSGQPLQPPSDAAVAGRPVLPFPLAHLWFLYVLALIYTVAVPVRAAIARVDAGGALRRAIDTGMRTALAGPWAPLVLGAPLIAVFLVSPWLLWSGIPTPDQSLVPNLPAAVGFSSAFAVGWLLHRQVALLKSIERWWAPHLAAAIGLTVACLALLGPSPSALSTTAPSAVLYTVLYVAGIWTWTLGLIGASLRFFSAESPVRRYISDASYWIYLAHLPLVVALQAAMKDWPLHWAVKFPVVLTVALALLFASYHLFVRDTFIGEVLNGVRHRRDRRGETPADARPAVRLSGESLAVLTDASKQFGKVKALDGLSLDVRAGELLAVLGPNGAGKSTAISLLLGLLEPDSGTATLFGQPPGNVEARYGVGVMMQEVTLAMEMSVRDLIALTTTYYPAPMTADETMALTNTTPLAEQTYGKLSAGQRRQVQFALAVCGRPSLLFLDEPTTGLDVQAREMLWQTIRRLLAQGASIVLTTHYLEEAEALATRVAVLARGRLAAMGTVDEIRGVVGRKRVSCVSSLAVEQVAAWASVDTATHVGGRLQIVARDADDVVRRLLAADASLRDLEVERAGLAEAFTEITQEAA
ncbi:MAG TPA: acyltransferase family protein [Vicinamibacterales bacterium]|nr:acyltransferase family protein [Vicinamibacterales bacterium]